MLLWALIQGMSKALPRHLRGGGGLDEGLTWNLGGGGRREGRGRARPGGGGGGGRLDEGLTWNLSGGLDEGPTWLYTWD